MQDCVTVIELFAGIGAFSKALTNLGVKHKILDAVEIDKYAVQSFNAVHGTNFEPQDITKWDKTFDEPVDFIMHGSPCQDFSVAGRQAGGDKGSGTRSSLMYETLRIVEKLKPKCVVWENVKNLLGKKHKHNFDAYQEAMRGLGYRNYYQILNAKDYGVPQNRERVFTVSIRNDIEGDYVFPEKQPLRHKLKDILEDNVDERYYLSDEQVSKIKLSNFTQERTRIQEGDISQTLLSRDYKDPKCVRESIVIDDYNQRVRADQDTMGALTTNCGVGAPRNGFKIAEPQTALEQPVDRDYKKHGKVRETQYEVKNDGVSHALRANGETLAVEPIKIKTANIKGYDEASDGCRIRKLTPLECWRLMGFDDSDFEKAEKVNSNSQLYKQAGNSIVVNCIQAIMCNVIGAMYGK